MAVNEFVELGMVPDQARELQRQINAKVGDKRKLMEMSAPMRLALEMQTQLNAKSGNARRLSEESMVPDLAKRVAANFTAITP